MNDILDFGLAKEYTPYQGDGSAVLLPFDGDIRAKVAKIKKGTSGSGNKTLKVVMHVDEEGFGGTLYKDIPYTGTRSDNKSNVEGVMDFLLSVGWTLEQIQQFAQQGQKVEIDKLISQVMAGEGIAFVSVEADVYQGKESSKVSNFITKTRYEENVRNGNARRPRAGASAGSTNGASAPAAGGADPLANLM